MTRGCHQHFTYSRAVRSKTNKRNGTQKNLFNNICGRKFCFLIPIGVFPRRFLFECDFICLRASGMLEYVGCSFVHHLLHWIWTKHCNFMFRIQRFFLLGSSLLVLEPHASLPVNIEKKWRVSVFVYRFFSFSFHLNCSRGKWQWKFDGFALFDSFLYFRR